MKQTTSLNGNRGIGDDLAIAEIPSGHEAATLADVVRQLKRIESRIAETSAELLDAEAAAALVGVSRATWDRMRSAGMVPAPVKLNGGTIIRWQRAILLNWIADGCPSKS